MSQLSKGSSQIIPEISKCVPNEHKKYLENRLTRWSDAAPRFQHFLQNNKTKIFGKIKSPKDFEDVADILAELEVAALLLRDNQYKLTYEPYGNSSDSNPDFLVSSNDKPAFILEVKRIREGNETVQYKNLLAEIVYKIRKIPSKLGIEFCADNCENPFDLLKKIKKEKDGRAS